MLSRFEALKQFKGKKVYVMTCPKGTIRDYFLIAANEAHACGIEKAITQMEQSLWGKMKLCRISMP